MTKDMREKAKSDQTKIKAMITDTSQAVKVELTNELKAMVDEQTTKILQYLKQISSNVDNVLMMADPTSEEVHTKLADDGQSAERRDDTLVSSHPTGTSSSNSSDDEVDK